LCLRLRGGGVRRTGMVPLGRGGSPYGTGPLVKLRWKPNAWLMCCRRTEYYGWRRMA